MRQPITPEKFWARLHKTDTCWVWTGATSGKGGYGKLTYLKRVQFAHRLAYIFTHGSIPAGMDVLHHCDNPPCCNPDHLFLGTARENVRDAIAKGRMHHKYPHPGARGEASPHAKLTWQDVKEIRAYPRYRGALADLSRRYGLTHSTIAAILHGKTWKPENTKD